MSQFLSLMALVVSVSGCAIRVIEDKPVSDAERHEYEQNYKTGEKQKAIVGDPIIKVRDYYVERIAVPAVTPSEDITLKMPGRSMVFHAGWVYPTRGQVTLDGVSYLVVPHSDDAKAEAAIVRPDGTIDTRRLLLNPSYGAIVQAFGQTVTPPHARMVRVTQARSSTRKGNQNYEILYNGVASGVLQFTYREFSPDDLARTAFYQNLSYDSKAESIRFKAFKIRVHSANSEAIEYTVLEDGR